MSLSVFLLGLPDFRLKVPPSFLKQSGLKRALVGRICLRKIQLQFRPPQPKQAMPTGDQHPSFTISQTSRGLFSAKNILANTLRKVELLHVVLRCKIKKYL